MAEDVRGRLSRYRNTVKVVAADTLFCEFILMKRDEAIKRLQQHEADLKRLGVEHLYMFDPTARFV